MPELNEFDIAVEALDTSLRPALDGQPLNVVTASLLGLLVEVNFRFGTKQSTDVVANAVRETLTYLEQYSAHLAKPKPTGTH